MLKRAFSIISLLIVASLALAACGLGGTPAPAVETIRVYSSLPMTGSSAGQITTVINAINMALDQQTTDRTICDGKFKIDYQPLDDATAAAGAWDAAKEQENANKAVADPDAMVYIGTFNSGAAAVSIPILNAAGMAMISPANTYTGLTKPAEVGEPDKFYPTGKRNYMRVVTADDIQGAVGAKWLASLGAKTVYILDDTQVYGKGLADVFEKSAAGAGLEVLGRDGIDSKAADYKALAAKIASTNPDGIYFGGITQANAGQLLKDIRGAGITAVFMGADGIREQAFVDAAGADVADGVYATVAGTPRESLPEKGQKFYEDYKAKFNGEPESYAIYGYEAASVVITALKSVCQKDRAAILNAMIGTRNFGGVLGTWSFDANGDTSLSDMVGNVVENGAWKETGLLQFP
jgi:branched-chain amino acid transport system substrate-binding protein